MHNLLSGKQHDWIQIRFPYRILETASGQTSTHRYPLSGNASGNHWSRSYSDMIRISKPLVLISRVTVWL
jgi:hypothetical protein